MTLPGTSSTLSSSSRRRRQSPSSVLPPPPPPHRMIDTISRPGVSHAALLSMAVADRENSSNDPNNNSTRTASTKHTKQQRAVKTAPPAPSGRAHARQPPVTTANSTATAATPAPLSGSATSVASTAAPLSSASTLRPSHARSNAGSSARIDCKLSTPTMIATTMLREPLLTATATGNNNSNNTPPLSGSTNTNSNSATTTSGGFVDPTTTPTTIWTMFTQTVVRSSASRPHTIALSGCDQCLRRPTAPPPTSHSSQSHSYSRSLRSRHPNPHPHRSHRHNRHTTAAAVEQHVTWPQYYDKTLAVARVLHHLAFASGDAACFIAQSSPALHFVHLAVVAVGGVACHLRPTWSSDELVNDIFPASSARLLVVDDVTPTVLDALRRLPTQFSAVLLLQADPIDLVVALDGAMLTYQILTLTDVWSLAKSVDEAVDNLLTPTTDPFAVCAIAFAYDERGRVRGVKLTHDNVLFTAATLAKACGPLSGGDRLVGYIPWHHVAAQVLECYLPLVSGCCVVCAPSYDAPLVGVITTKKPTIFFATPDTWTHVSFQVYRAKRQVNAHLYRWAKTRATHNSTKLLFGHDAHRSLGYMLAKTLVLNSIKKRLGLESCVACYSVLAPLDFELEKLFQTVDIPIYQLFGCAESSGFAAVNYPHAWAFGSSGRALEHTTIACDDVTHEVLLHGRNVFAGYVYASNAEAAEGADEAEPRTLSTALSATTLTSSATTLIAAPLVTNSNRSIDRTLRFRQTGFLTPNGFLTINDPPDFVVLATGDWVPVAPIERALLQSESALDRVVLVGEGRPFLSVLLFLKTKHSASGKARAAVLSDDAVRVGKLLGSTATTIGDAIVCQRWAVHFDLALENLRKSSGLSGFFVRKWILMADAFSVETGELDPDTRDVKRKVVDRKYQSLLDSLYT